MLAIRSLGRLPYRQVWELQEQLRQERAGGIIPDTLLLCEHPPVFTIGRQDCRTDWKATWECIAQAGIEVVQVNRGGRITYHGPGQLVGYFIVDLHARQCRIHDFVTWIENLLIATLARFDVRGRRDPAYPGVWVAMMKVAAIGLHVSRGVTQHGFALNVAPDLTHYQYIVPCGIQGRGVTSLAEILTAPIPTLEVVSDLLGNLARQLFQTASKVGFSPASFGVAGTS